MDTSFIGQPHHWDPRRLYSQTGADWQQRVDFERLRKDRMQRVQEQMKARDLGALVLLPAPTFATRRAPIREIGNTTSTSAMPWCRTAASRCYLRRRAP